MPYLGNSGQFSNIYEKNHATSTLRIVEGSALYDPVGEDYTLNATFQEVTNIGPSTTNTVKFNNTGTSLTTLSRVGVANAAPSYKLSVGQAVHMDDANDEVLIVNGKARVLSNLNVEGNINFDGTLYQNGVTFSGGGGSSLWTAGTNSLYYRSNVEVGTGNLFVDTTTSNVGIGSTTPSYTLDVDGDIHFSGNLYQNGTEFVSGGGNGGGGGSSLWTSGTNSIYYRSNVEVGTGNLFVDTTTSNVGIGSTTPSYTLDVAGDINFTGSLLENGTAFTLGSIETNLSDNSSRITAISNDLSSNATRIDNLTTDLSSNATRIDNLTADLSTLTTDLSSNATRIDNLTTDLSTLTTDLSSNATRIDNLTTDLSTLTTDLSSNATRIDNLTTDLSSNATRIDNLTTDLSTLTTDLSSNATRIDNLTTDLSSNATRIDNLTTDLSSNVTRIENLESASSPWTSNVDTLYYSTSNVAIGNSYAGYELHVEGNVYATQDVSAFSDARFKENVEPIGNALEKVCSIGGYTYNKIGDPRRNAGVLAQEVMTVLPEVVHGSEDTNYSVSYGNMVSLLIEAIKELKLEMEKISQSKT